MKRTNFFATSAATSTLFASSSRPAFYFSASRGVKSSTVVPNSLQQEIRPQQHAQSSLHLEAQRIPAVVGTKENLAAYGEFISNEVYNPGLSIPFYKGSVVEGGNFQFVCNGAPTARTAQINPRESTEVTWLERHMRMTQMFVGLGNTPFVMILGEPTNQSKLPDMSKVKAFIIPPGTGLMIHKGTWHDFPVAIRKPVTVLTYNSAEVVEALASMKEPAEMDFGDVYKLRLSERLHKKFFFDLDEIKKLSQQWV